MSMDFESFWRTLLLERRWWWMYVFMGISGCGWPILLRATRIGYAYWQLLKKAPTSASETDAITFFIMFDTV